VTAPAEPTPATVIDITEQRHRGELLRLAAIAIRLPSWDPGDDLATHSRIGDERARDRVFSDLCTAVADRDNTWAEGVLDLLRGIG
jgi:hypothetical protein